MTWVELYQVVRIPKFSRIPPACCPYLPACTARGRDLVWVVPAWSQGDFTCLVWGCTWSGGVPGLGVYLAGPGGCTCLVVGAYLPGPRGTCLVQGYLPGPGGCTWSGEGVPAWSWRGCPWSWEVYMVWGGVPGPRGVPAQALPPVNRILDTRF